MTSERNSETPAPTLTAATLLLGCELFGELDAATLNEVASELEVVRLGRGDVLSRQGDPANCMYAIVNGRLQQFTDNGDGEERFMAELRSGETVGEVELVGWQRRLTTVRAVRDSELVKVSRLGFERLVRENPGSLNRLANILAKRIEALGRRQIPVPILKTIAVFGAGQPADDFDFNLRLLDALGVVGQVLHLNEVEFRRIFGVSFESGRGVGAWLGELEHAYRFLLLDADGGSPEWTAYCLRQADRVLTVGQAWASPEVTAREKRLFAESAAGKAPPVELVLLHDESGRLFSHTAKWLTGREVIRHHHVRIKQNGDMSRLARILGGCAIGLALSGGGARGFAHIGVIRAIEEAGIPIDMICGTSMGAIIAGQYAMGWDWKTMIRMNGAEMAGGKLVSDFTIPIVSLSSGRRFRRALDSFFGATEIEDLWLNYFCASCNLSTSKLMIHRRGALKSAVNASNAIPGVLPPVLSGGQLLVDGGILNNEPGDLLKEICGGSVVVSSVRAKKDVTVDEAFSEMPSPWRVLRSWLSPFEKKIRVPGVSATMIRALMVASDRKSREVERSADFYLRPPTDRFRLDAFSKVEEIAEVGYQYARGEIRTWQEDNRRPGLSG